MQYRKLGKYGIHLSAVGFGTWLTVGYGITENKSRECIKTSLDCGINFFDTADIYNKGEAEKTLGNILFRDFNVNRDKLVIATKCFFPMSDNPNDRGLSRKHIFESAEKSLKRLRTYYIDLYQCHRFDNETPLEETCRAFNDLIIQGKLLYWGVSEWSAQNIEDAVVLCEKYNLHKPVSNQPQYNIIKPQIETNGVMSVCVKYGLGQVVWSPLAQGLLTGKYSGGKIISGTRASDEKMGTFIKEKVNEEIAAKIDRLKELAESYNLSAAQLSIAWCLRKNNISSAIIGASKPEQVIENCKAAEIEITEETERIISEIFY